VARSARKRRGNAQNYEDKYRSSARPLRVIPRGADKEDEHKWVGRHDRIRRDRTAAQSRREKAESSLRKTWGGDKGDQKWGPLYYQKPEKKVSWKLTWKEALGASRLPCASGEMARRQIMGRRRSVAYKGANTPKGERVNP